MATEGIKEKKAQIKTIVKNYEAQLDIPAAGDEAKEAEKAADKNGPQAMETDNAEGKPSLNCGMSLPTCLYLLVICVNSLTLPCFSFCCAEQYIADVE